MSSRGAPARHMPGTGGAHARSSPPRWAATNGGGAGRPGGSPTRPTKTILMGSFSNHEIWPGPMDRIHSNPRVQWSDPHSRLPFDAASARSRAAPAKAPRTTSSLPPTSRNAAAPHTQRRVGRSLGSGSTVAATRGQRGARLV